MTGSVFNIPFKFNDTGQISTVIDETTAWRQRIIMVLATKFGERVMRPDFGSNLGDTLFEDEILAAEIAQRTITIAFNKWLSSLKLLEVQQKYDYSTGYMEITIIYELPSGNTDSVSVNTAIFNRSGDLIQELSNG